MRLRGVGREGGRDPFLEESVYTKCSFGVEQVPQNVAVLSPGSKWGRHVFTERGKLHQDDRTSSGRKGKQS